MLKIKTILISLGVVILSFVFSIALFKPESSLAQLFTFTTKQGGTGTRTSPEAGQILIGLTNGSYSPAYLTAGANITISTSSGTITITGSAGGGGANFGTGSAGQIAIFNGTNTGTSSQLFTFATSTGVFTVNGLASSSGLIFATGTGTFLNITDYATITAAKIGTGLNAIEIGGSVTPYVNGGNSGEYIEFAGSGTSTAAFANPDNGFVALLNTGLISADRRFDFPDLSGVLLIATGSQNVIFGNATATNLNFTSASGTQFSVSNYGIIPTLRFTNASGSNQTLTGLLEVEGRTDLGIASTGNLTVGGVLGVTGRFDGTLASLSNVSLSGLLNVGGRMDFGSASGTNLFLSGYSTVAGIASSGTLIFGTGTGTDLFLSRNATTNSLTVTGLTSAIPLAGADGSFTEYAGSACGGSDQVVSISAVGAVTCSSQGAGGSFNATGSNGELFVFTSINTGTSSQRLTFATSTGLLTVDGTASSSGLIFGIGTGTSLTLSGDATVSNLTISSIASGNCLQSGLGGLVTSAGQACGSGGASSSPWFRNSPFVYLATSSDQVGINATNSSARLTVSNFITQSGTNSLVYLTATSSKFTLIGGNASGTLLAFNDLAYSGDFIHFQVASATKFKLDSLGNASFTSATLTTLNVSGQSGLGSVSGSNLTLTGYGTIPTLNFTSASGTQISVSGYGLFPTLIATTVSSSNASLSNLTVGLNAQFNSATTNSFSFGTATGSFLNITGNTTSSRISWTNASGGNLSLSGVLGVSGRTDGGLASFSNLSLSGVLGVTGRTDLGLSSASNLHLSGILGVSGRTDLGIASSGNHTVGGLLNVTGRSDLTAVSGTNLYLSGYSQIAGIASSGTLIFGTGTGTDLFLSRNVTTSSLTISGIASGIQCLHASATGVVSGTGADCGSGGVNPWAFNTGFVYLATTTDRIGIGATSSGIVLNIANAMTQSATASMFLLNTSTSILTIQGGSASGTLIAANPSLFNGDFINFQVNSSSKFSVNSLGAVSSTALTVSGISGSTQCLQVNSAGVVTGSGAACSGGSQNGWVNANSYNYLINGTSDTVGIGGTTSSAKLYIRTANVATTSLWIQAMAAQTADLLRISTTSGADFFNISATGTITFTNKLIDSSNGGRVTATNTNYFLIENPAAAEDDVVHIFDATSTITQLRVVNKLGGDTISFNLIWGATTSRTDASSTARKLFTTFQTSSATLTPDILAPNGSTTVPGGSIMRLITSSSAAAVSSSQFFLQFYYYLNATQ